MEIKSPNADEEERDYNYKHNDYYHNQNYTNKTGYKKKKYNPYLKEDDVWNIATTGEVPQEENQNMDQSYEKVQNTKPKRIIRRDDQYNTVSGTVVERKKSEIDKDKVVIHVGNAKSIKDIFS